MWTPALRLHVATDSLRMESSPDQLALQEGIVQFMDEFYPLDTGPLAPPYGLSTVHRRGLHIALPEDVATLAQLSGRFILRAR
jgi:hypothetical protein